MTEMKKLGKYSGTVYDFYDKNIPECCSTIEAKLAEDKEYVQTQHQKDLMDCVMHCLMSGAPASDPLSEVQRTIIIFP